MSSIALPRFSCSISAPPTPTPPRWRPDSSGLWSDRVMHQRGLDGRFIRRWSGGTCRHAPGSTRSGGAFLWPYLPTVARRCRSSHTDWSYGQALWIGGARGSVARSRPVVTELLPLGRNDEAFDGVQGDVSGTRSAERLVNSSRSRHSLKFPSWSSKVATLGPINSQRGIDQTLLSWELRKGGGLWLP